MTSNSPSNVYQEMEISTSNNLQLVVMLYDGAIRFLNQAKTAIHNKSLAGKAQAFDRTLAILGELQSTLKLEEGGEIATSLDNLYTYMTERIIEASSRLDIGLIEEVIKLLKILESAWSEIAQRAEAPNETAVSSTEVPLPLPSAAVGGTHRTLEVFG